MARHVSAPRDDTNRAAMGLPGFVGRSSELATLATAFAAQPAVVLIEGEAGIGKTRLLEEFLTAQASRRDRTLLARCLPFRQPHTLGPVVDAIRHDRHAVAGLPLSALAGALRPLFPEWAPELPPGPEPAADATAARHRLFRALRELLGCLGVTVLVLEDAHWADEATLELLLYLTSQPPPRVNLVVTYRPEDVPATSPLRLLATRLTPGARRERIVLPALGTAETSSLVSSMLAGERVCDELVTFLHQRTDGVPLAVEELVRLMRDRGHLVRRDGEWMRQGISEVDVPPTIRDAVLERVQGLDDGAQTLLRSAAVLAEGAAEGTLASVAGLAADRARAALVEALTCGLLHEDEAGMVAFRHTLFGRAVYEAIPGPERRQLHHQAGLALEACTRQEPGRLARHFREAGDTGRWCRYAERAADLALSSGDEASAAAWLYDVLVSEVAETPLFARLMDKIPLGSLSGDASFLDLVSALQKVLASGSLEPGEEAGLRFQLARVLLSLDDAESARQELELAVPNLAPGSMAALRAMILLGHPLGKTCDAPTHLRWLQRAARAVNPSVSPTGQMRLLVDRTAAMLMLGEEAGWELAEQIPADAPTHAERYEITRGELNVGHQALRWGRYALARQRLARARENTSEHQYPQLHHAVLVTQLYLDWHTGAWDGLSERATSLARDDNLLPMARAEAALVSGLLQAAAYDRAQAEACLTQALTEAQRRGALEYLMEPAGALAKMWLADGRADDALAATEEPMGIVSAKQIWLWATEIAPARVAALLASGRSTEAAALVASFAAGLRGRDAPAPKAALATCRAMLAEAQGARSCPGEEFARAARMWQALPRPYDALLAAERGARCRLAAGDPATALPALLEAFEGLCRLGAWRGADRLVETLREHGLAVRLPGRGGRPSYGNRLSPREIDVMRVLVGGRTNRQIAETLGISPKTVASHLHAAMGKLQVTSRTALAVAATELGIVSRHETGVAPGAVTTG